MPGEPAAGCVFCHPEVQPEALAEGEHVRLVPDKYPLFPGHLLVITRRHLACLGAAPPEVHAEVEAMAERARRFLAERYGAPFTWENGVAGQSVFHAHLHLVPGPELTLPAPEEAGDWVPVSGWADVAAWYQEHGHYHYAQRGDDRRLMVPDGELLWRMRAILGGAANLRYVDGRFVRSTTPEDVAEVARRWHAWSGSQARP